MTSFIIKEAIFTFSGQISLAQISTWQLQRAMEEENFEIENSGNNNHRYVILAILVVVAAIIYWLSKTMLHG